MVSFSEDILNDRIVYDIICKFKTEYILIRNESSADTIQKLLILVLRNELWVIRLWTIMSVIYNLVP